MSAAPSRTLVTATLAAACLLSVATSKRTYRAQDSAPFQRIVLGPEVDAAERDLVVSVGGMPKPASPDVWVTMKLTVGKDAPPTQVRLEVLDDRGRPIRRVDTEVAGEVGLLIPHFQPACEALPCETWWVIRTTLLEGGPVTIDGSASARFLGLDEPSYSRLKLLVEVPRRRPGSQ